MARYVVLYFEDNEVAGGVASGRDSILQEAVALVPAPTLFCECGIRGGTKGRSFFQGPKYGWWCCSKCGKPTEAWGTHYAAVISAGKNLLEVEHAQD